MYDPEGTWKRRGVYSAVVLIAVLLIGSVVSFLAVSQDGDDNEATPATTQNPATSPPSDTGSAAPGSDSICGLPAGDQTIPNTPIPADWTQIDGMAAPTSTTYGPGLENNRIHSCFAHNPQGAILAGVMLTAERDDAEQTDGRKLITERALPGQTADEALAGEDDGERATSGPSFQVRGYRFLSYDEQRASYEVVYQIARGSNVGSMIAIVTNVQWHNGDWYNVIDSGLRPAVSTVTSLDPSYVAWSSEGSPALNRAAPAWALTVRTPQTAVLQSEVTQEDASGCNWKDPLACAADPVGAVGDAVGAAAGGVAGNIFDEAAKTAQNAAEEAMTTMLTAWLKYPDPDVEASDSITAWVNGHLVGLVAFVTVGSVIVSAMKLVVTGQYDNLRDVGSLLTRVVLTAGLVGTVVGLGLQIGDEFSQWIIDESNLDLGGSLVGFAFTTNPFLIIAVASVVVVTQIIQLGLMVARAGVIGFLVGALPLMAAGSGTGTGKQSFQKAISWLIAFVLYKPVAALIYAGALRMISGDQDLANQVSGAFVMVLAIFALPAMMRLIAPVTGALGGANAGGMAASMAGTALATGAVMMTGGAAAAGLAGGAGGMTSGGAAMGAGGGAAGGVATSGGAAGGASGAGGPGVPSTTAGAGPGGAQGDTGAEGSIATTAENGGGVAGGAASGAAGGGAGATQQIPDNGASGGRTASGALDAGVRAAGAAGDVASGAIEGDEQ